METETSVFLKDRVEMVRAKQRTLLKTRDEFSMPNEVIRKKTMPDVALGQVRYERWQGARPCMTGVDYGSFDSDGRIAGRKDQRLTIPVKIHCRFSISG